MKFLKIMVFLAVLSLITLSSKGTAESPTYTPTPTEFISYYATKYGIDKSILLSVAKCESNLKPNAIHYNDGGKGKHSFGVMQFQESTFSNWEKVLGEDLDYYSYQDQIKLASFMMSRGQYSQWSCYTKLYSK